MKKIANKNGQSKKRKEGKKNGQDGENIFQLIMPWKDIEASFKSKKQQDAAVQPSLLNFFEKSQPNLVKTKAQAVANSNSLSDLCKQGLAKVVKSK